MLKLLAVKFLSPNDEYVTSGSDDRNPSIRQKLTDMMLWRAIPAIRCYQWNGYNCQGTVEMLSKY